MQQAATDNTIAWPPRGDRLCHWENQRMLSSFNISLNFCSCSNGCLTTTV